MLAEVVITGPDVIQWGLPATVGGAAVWFRRYLLSALRALWLLAGFLIFVVKAIPKAKPFLNKVRNEPMSPILRQVFNGAEWFVDEISSLYDEGEHDASSTMEDRLMARLQQFIDASKEQPKLIIPDTPPAPKGG